MATKETKSELELFQELQQELGDTLAEEEEISKQLASVKPVIDGKYIVKIDSYTVSDGKLTVNYALTDAKGNAYPTIRESFTVKGLQMFLDKLTVIITYYNMDHNADAATERTIDDIIGFPFLAQVARRMTEQFINYTVMPLARKSK